jgi:hypothetical protein
MARLATFWSGPLTALERTCLTSFVRCGHEVAVYSYDGHPPLDRVAFRDAATLLPSAFLGRFRTDGRPNIAHFADYFRLVMMRRTGETWVDCDMFCRPAGAGDQAEVWDRDILVQEASGRIINCVLNITDDTLLGEATARVEALLDRDLPWAATQNILPSAIRAIGYGAPLTPARFFSPVEAGDWATFLLPEERERCAQVCEQACAVHVYNNILQKIGYLKEALPPEGSYLHALIVESGMAEAFTGIYPAETVRTLARNWRLRFNGEDVGFRSLARQLLPSLRRTVRRQRYR